jgi:hypothetical protein
MTRTGISPEEQRAAIERIHSASASEELATLRRNVGALIASRMIHAGQVLHVVGHVIGSGRVEGTSPRGGRG